MQTESPNTPALNAARAEMTDIATNHENPRYTGYQKGDPQVMQYLDELYKKAAPGPAPASGIPPVRRIVADVSTVAPPPPSVHIGGTESLTLGPADPQPGETPEEAEIRARNEVILAPLKQEWGADYDRRYESAVAGARTLFEGRGEVLDELGSIVRVQYGPSGERAALRFLAELEHIKQGG
ncbi:MAG: hypothetical protein ACYDGR_16550 [Candidatus Dormibacteria bacterium]